VSCACFSRPALLLTRRDQFSQGLGTGSYRDILNTYWQQVVTALETENHDYKIHQLPLARIKKVMKADPEVKMISAEAPIIFAKACETFITELTMRAWIHAEENKRRTLQRSDIAAALSKSDMFDFLIDIVPREDATPQHKRRPDYAEPQPGAQDPGHVPQPSQQQHQQPQHEFLSAQPEQQVPQAYYPQQPVFDPNMYGQVYNTGAPPEQQGQYGSG
jgi:nuclear transcription factor Y gamma